MKTRFLLFAALAGLLLAACQPHAAPDVAYPEPAGSADSLERSPTVAATAVDPVSAPTPLRETSVPDARPERDVRLLTPRPITPEPILTLEEQMPTTGEVPDDLLQQMVDDLSQRLDVSADEIVIQRAERVVWRDGALGCPKPGQVYTQALVNGYRVTLAAGDQLYNYHANNSGYFFLCDNPTPPIKGPPAGSSDR